MVANEKIRNETRGNLTAGLYLPMNEPATMPDPYDKHERSATPIRKKEREKNVRKNL